MAFVGLGDADLVDAADERREAAESAFEGGFEVGGVLSAAIDEGALRWAAAAPLLLPGINADPESDPASVEPAVGADGAGGLPAPALWSGDAGGDAGVDPLPTLWAPPPLATRRLPPATVPSSPESPPAGIACAPTCRPRATLRPPVEAASAFETPLTLPSGLALSIPAFPSPRPSPFTGHSFTACSETSSTNATTAATITPVPESALTR